MPRLFLLCVLLAGLPTSAGRGSIAGVVTDNRGNELPRAPATDGRYRFVSVSEETDRRTTRYGQPIKTTGPQSDMSAGLIHQSDTTTSTW